MRGSLIILLFPITSFCQTWSLDQCIDSALLNNITLKKSVVTSEIAHVTLQNSKQNLLPSLNASTVHGYNWGQTIDPFTNQFATNRVQYDNLYLSSNIALFSGLQNYYTIKANGTASNMSVINQKIAERNLKIDVTAAYLQVLLNKSIFELSSSNLEKTKIQFDRINELKSAHQATKFDVSEIEAQLSQDQYEVTKAKNDVSYSMLLLQQIMNTSTKDSFDLDAGFIQNGESTSLLVPQVFDINALNDSSIINLPEILAVQLGVEKQLFLLKSIKGRYYPSLLLSGSLGSGYSGNNKMILDDGSFSPKPFGRQLNENFYQSAQLTLSIPIFNKNATRNQVKIAEYQMESLALDQENTFNELKQKIEQLKLDIINESEQYNALQKVYESSLLNFQNFTTRFENGDANYSQLTEVQNKLLSAETKLVQSEFQLKFKSTLLGFYFGE